MIKKFIEICKFEAKQENSSANANNSGKQIEKYLAPFRPFLGEQESFNKFSNPAIGYDWCGSFVHYCLKKAGLDLPIQPYENEPTFALVYTWYKYATEKKCWFTDINDAEVGDLILFKHETDENRQFKHIGVIINKENNVLQTAEGNVKYFNDKNELRRKTKIVTYSDTNNIKGFVKTEELK